MVPSVAPKIPFLARLAPLIVAIVSRPGAEEANVDDDADPDETLSAEAEHTIIQFKRTITNGEVVSKGNRPI